ncbi:VQ motif-containing protein motif-containing protein 4 [Forsythia ovata]|uniref:VQ motif-containing protein motif-containing protein 4 n=1 Tax=Forsythia ovata TaxID=205694 RepID=A0ABD1QCV9_9LAMI
MDNPPKIQENYKPSLIQSPNRNSSNYSSSSTTTAAAFSNGLHYHHPSPPSQPSAIPITRPEPSSPYPTTFVQADTSSFKLVVQMLTGSTETVRQAAKPDPVKNPIPPIKTGLKKEKSATKLCERRSSFKNFNISPLINKSGFVSGYSGSPRTGTPELLSPSILDFPSLVLSPVTPLISDPFKRSALSDKSDMNLDMEAENKAIKEKGFYLHPSPVSTPRDSEPRLLPLFPVTLPRVAGSSSAVNS